MIENEHQYQITTEAAQRFEAALAEIENQSLLMSDVHPILREAQKDAIRCQLEDLQAELHDYELRRTSVLLVHQVGHSQD